MGGILVWPRVEKRKSVVVQAKDDDGLDYMMAIKMDEKC